MLLFQPPCSTPAGALFGQLWRLGSGLVLGGPQCFGFLLVAVVRPGWGPGGVPGSVGCEAGRPWLVSPCLGDQR